MYKKHIILGIGIGIFISSLVFYISIKVSKYNTSTERFVMDFEDEYIIDKATEMGMIFFDKITFESNKENTETGEIIISPDNFVYITVPKNSTAIEVSDILEKNGLIEDKADFTNYIIDENLQRNLQHGDFLIPIGVSYEQLLNILIKKQ